MKNIFTLALFCCTSLLAFAQGDKVVLAEAALAKNDFAGAYELANAALQSSQSLDKNSLAKASYIRGKAGVKIAYDAMIDGDEAEEKKYVDEGYINGGVYVMDASFFDTQNFDKKFSFEKEVLEKLVTKKHFWGVIFDSYFIDIGIPEDYYKAQSDFR